MMAEHRNPTDASVLEDYSRTDANHEKTLYARTLSTHGYCLYLQFPETI